MYPTRKQTVITTSVVVAAADNPAPSLFPRAAASSALANRTPAQPVTPPPQSGQSAALPKRQSGMFVVPVFWASLTFAVDRRCVEQARRAKQDRVAGRGCLCSERSTRVRLAGWCQRFALLLALPYCNFAGSRLAMPFAGNTQQSSVGGTMRMVSALT